jgi:uracil-DNA glycosylase
MAASLPEQFNIHHKWIQLFPQSFESAFELLSNLENYQPNANKVFKVFETSPDDIQLVVVGQDPYPKPGDAIGLAFSVDSGRALPKSLSNIFKELKDDLGIVRTDGNLSDWQAQGVFLINRILTVPNGQPLGHQNLGWEEFTEEILAYLGNNGKVALLMGNSAQELAKYFDRKILTAHPSPLSAYRGFFGSKPFSRINELLPKAIKW